MCSAEFTECNFVLLQKYSFVHRNELQQYSLQLYVQQRQFTRKKKKIRKESRRFSVRFSPLTELCQVQYFKLNEYDKKSSVAERALALLNTAANFSAL